MQCDEDEEGGSTSGAVAADLSDIGDEDAACSVAVHQGRRGDDLECLPP